MNWGIVCGQGACWKASCYHSTMVFGLAGTGAGHKSQGGEDPRKRIAPRRDHDGKSMATHQLPRSWTVQYMACGLADTSCARLGTQEFMAPPRPRTAVQVQMQSQSVSNGGGLEGGGPVRPEALGRLIRGSSGQVPEDDGENVWMRSLFTCRCWRWWDHDAACLSFGNPPRR